MKRFAIVAAASTSLLLPVAGATGATASAAAPAIFHQPRIPGHAVHNAGWSSSNWSGYAQANGTYSAATASWVVPSVTPSRGSTYSSAWVGIDGFNNSSLIQTGTESDYYNGSVHYNAWWEILPAAETPITSFSVRPGDLMSASIKNDGGGLWTITISDNHGGSFTTQQKYSGPGSSVEWIEEAPTVGGHVATLAQYSSPDTFDPGTANGANPGLQASDGGTMVQKRRTVSTPSIPDGDGDGFNMAYGSTAPAPPAT